MSTSETDTIRQGYSWLLHALIPGTTLASLLLLFGCQLAPKYTRPQVPAPPAYKELSASGAGTMVDWKPAQPSDTAIRGKWWEAFNDAQLNGLEDQIDISNQNIAAAAANYAAARSIVREARSQFFPTLTAAASINNERLSVFGGNNLSSGATFTQYSLPIEASWEPDLWGRVRNTANSAVYAAQASAADLENVRLAAHAQLAMNYFAVRTQISLKQVLDSAVTSDQDTLKLTRDLYRSGLATDEAVAAAEAQLQAAQATDENVGILRAQYEHAIALLLGKAPADFSLTPKPLDARPAFIPPGVPAELLERRPDIAAAERAVAQANQQIGIARSAYFPNITLAATGGLTSLSASDWFTWPSHVWAVGPAIAETLFDAGLRRATVQQYRSLYDQAVAVYRQTTLIAFQQVEDNLAALRILHSEVTEQQSAAASAQRAFDEATVRYKAGLDPYLNVIQAQMTLLNYQQAAVILNSQEMIASVQLMQALGGGWQTSQLPNAKAVSAARSH